MLEKEYNNNKIIFFPGFLISVMGSALFSFATGLYLLETTKKGFLFGVNLMLLIVPMIIFGPYFGKLGDKYSRKFIIILGDFLNALLMFGIFLLWDKVDRIYLIYIGTFFSSLFSNLVTITFSAGVPEFFGKKWMIQANSITQIANALAKITGPFIGGIIYGYGNLNMFILANGISFLISMILECFLKLDRIRDKDREDSQNLRDVFRFIMGHREMKDFIMKVSVLNFAVITAILVPIPYIVTKIMNQSSSFLGGVQAAIPLGAIIGAIMVNQTKITLNKNILWWVIITFFIACLMFMTPYFVFAASFWVKSAIAAGMFIAGMTFGVLDVTANTFFQTEIPENMRGKTLGVIGGLVKSTMPVSYLVSGAITDKVSPFASIILGIILLLGTMVVTLCLEIIQEGREKSQIV